MNNFKTIAIDGPAGAGKSTIAKTIAAKLSYEYIDTGAMYRAMTLKLIKLNRHGDEIKDVLDDTHINFINNCIFLDGQNVDQEIRTPEVNEKVSAISAQKIVREKLIDIQRKIGKEKNVIMDGRDIGTNVFPKATYKFYITATAKERAYRRWIEMKNKGFSINLKEVELEIKKRDQMDMERKHNPLCKADDAIEIDTTGKTKEEVVKEILSYIKTY